jgi:methylaspartate ammonia-lyase
MTNDEYRQLIGFLGQKFGEVDRQFVEVRAEMADMRRGLTMVQDGVTETRQDLAAFKDETQREFADVKTLIRLSYADLDRRVRGLEGER